MPPSIKIASNLVNGVPFDYGKGIVGPGLKGRARRPSLSGNVNVFAYGNHLHVAPLNPERIQSRLFTPLGGFTQPASYRTTSVSVALPVDLS